MRIFGSIVALAVFSFQVAQADTYEVSVTRKGQNIYKIDGRDVLIQTRYCYEYVYYEDAFLKMSGYSGEVVFAGSGSKCDVKAVFGLSDQAGKFSIEVTRQEDDWYEIVGQDMFVKTSNCYELALSEDAILSISAGGYGTLFIGDDKCIVEGVYARMRL